MSDVGYALANIVSYALTYGSDDLVILALGDHQPAPFVTGESESHDVPVHLISRDSNKLMGVLNSYKNSSTFCL